MMTTVENLLGTVGVTDMDEFDSEKLTQLSHELVVQTVELMDALTEGYSPVDVFVVEDPNDPDENPALAFKPGNQDVAVVIASRWKGEDE